VTVDSGLLGRVREHLARHQAELSPSGVAAALREQGAVLGDAAVLEVLDGLRREALGAGHLEPLLQLDGVTDILVNGPDAVFVDRGAGLERTAMRFADDDAVRRLAQRLAASAGRRLDDSSPHVDVRLRGGIRFHAVLAPVASPGTCLSLRVPARRRFGLPDLVASGTVPVEGAEVLQRIVDSRCAFLVSGGTGSGKTTLLSTLLSCVDRDHRIVIVEDASELQPGHPHVVSLEARQANVEGVGEITLRDLVRQCLRMRPDRLVVGEVRGAEIVEMLAAMNTGHEGGCGTIHANSPQAVPARLEALGIAAGLTREAVHAQVSAALELVIHVRRCQDGRREVDEIAVVGPQKSGLIEVVPAVRFDRGQVKVCAAGSDLETLLRRRDR
jgi:pilus assembly protein CpaF